MDGGRANAGGTRQREERKGITFSGTWANRRDVAGFINLYLMTATGRPAWRMAGLHTKRA